MPALSILTSAVGGFANAFNKGRYRTEYHDATQSISAVNEQIKKQIEQLKRAKLNQQFAPKQEQKLMIPQTTIKTENSLSWFKSNMKTIAIVGGAVLTVLVIYLLKGKRKSKLS